MDLARPTWEELLRPNLSLDENAQIGTSVFLEREVGGEPRRTTSMHTPRRPIRRAIAMTALAAILGVLPLAAHAGDGDPRGGTDQMHEGCEIPGSSDGLGDTLAVVSRLTCG
jgi:hypothetical protein